MSHIAVDTNLPDCPEVVELEEILGVEEIWKHLFYLWAWAFDADFQTGNVKLTPKMLARHARWDGDAQAFFDALCIPVGPRKVPWLVNKGKGYFYLRGWSRNGRFFKKKEQGRERQRRYREQLDASRDALRDDNGDGDVCPDSSPSRSPSPSPSRSRSRSPSLSTLTLTQVEEVIDHYLEARPEGKRPAKNKGAWRKVAARLKEGRSAQDLKDAIDGMLDDDFYQSIGKVQLSFACQSDDRVDELIGKKHARKRPSDPTVGWHPGSPPEDFEGEDGDVKI